MSHGESCRAVPRPHMGLRRLQLNAPATVPRARTRLSKDCALAMRQVISGNRCHAHRTRPEALALRHPLPPAWRYQTCQAREAAREKGEGKDRGKVGIPAAA